MLAAACSGLLILPACGGGASSSVTPSSTAPAARWDPDRGGREVAYLDSAGSLFVASADGSSTRTVAQGVCAGTTTGKNEVSWSTDTQLIAVTCAGPT